MEQQGQAWSMAVPVVMADADPEEHSAALLHLRTRSSLLDGLLWAHCTLLMAGAVSNC